MRVDLDPLRQRVIINRGTTDGAFKGQPILDATGVFGQIARAGAYSSEVILISDIEHAIPVQVNRNGLRTIAVGTGDPSRLSLPFLAANVDIEVGDLLVSSGLGGAFPSGYPVGTVTSVNAQAIQTMAEISAKPAAALDRDREVLMVWLKTPAPDSAADAAGKSSAPVEPNP
jgi:rod shape-determining protein MreC